jgi:hypothetical protein
MVKLNQGVMFTCDYNTLLLTDYLIVPTPFWGCWKAEAQTH